jgi:hypothetical protein
VLEVYLGNLNRGATAAKNFGVGGAGRGPCNARIIPERQPFSQSRRPEKTTPKPARRLSKRVCYHFARRQRQTTFLIVQKTSFPEV